MIATGYILIILNALLAALNLGIVGYFLLDFGEMKPLNLSVSALSIVMACSAYRAIKIHKEFRR